jgi:hypothetical protein
VVGVYIHNLEDRDGYQSPKGRNPFDNFTIDKKPFSNIVKAYDPPFRKSSEVYAYIKDNIANWVEESILIRNRW